MIRQMAEFIDYNDDAVYLLNVSKIVSTMIGIMDSNQRLEVVLSIEEYLLCST
jgi:hypothetical protein